MNTYPHITTQADYDEYVAAFDAGIVGLRYLSTGACPGCDGCGLADIDDMDCLEYEMAAEPFFSRSPCDVCGRHLGGDRHPAHYCERDGSAIHVEICVDCLYYSEYGRLDDLTMLELEL